MKFCKNLQQIVEIADPEWAPYWTNYKMLKKLIKELPSLVPVDEKEKEIRRLDSSNSASGSQSQNNGPDLSETGPASCHDEPSLKKKNNSVKKQPETTKKKAMGKSPGEIAFFKLLHSELKKAAKFFDRTKQEFLLREERVRDGMEIIRKPNSIMLPDKWSTMAKSIYRLYKDLLLLELYAIMTYCSFSKILKKHDKVTGYSTRILFMANVVNKANFTHYPEVLAMIQRSEKLFEEVSQKLLIEGTSALCEDERLFISMIHRFYGQIMDKAAEEGKPNAALGVARHRGGLNGTVSATNSLAAAHQKLTPTRKDATSLKTLVEENDARVKDGSACLSDDPDETTRATGKNSKRPLENLLLSAEVMANEDKGVAKKVKR